MHAGILLSILSFGCDSAENDKTGTQVYQTFCVHCHQANGKGVATRYPPLDQSSWLEGDMPVKIILHGLKGPIEVQGETYTNVMAPWGNVLSDQEIASVVQYVRSSWSNSEKYKNVPPITEEQVSTVRKKYAGHGNWTVKQLQENNK